MLTLLTGQPGAGKTLRMIQEIMEEKKKQPHRPVYIVGVAGLDPSLGWHELDRKEDWHKVPEGSIVGIDECQDMWRTRGVGAVVPEYVSAMEIHRHRGLDVFGTTQHPMLIDSNIRRLVGRHLHVMRTFGLNRATVHEWHSLKSEPDKNRADSIRHEWGYPKEVFALYKSAEIHTVKARIPKRVWVMLLLPLVLGALIYVIALRVKGFVNQDQLKKTTGAAVVVSGSDSSGPVARGGAAPHASVREYVESRQARIAGFVHTAPVYDDVTKPSEAPAPVACISSGSRGCKCFSQQGTSLPVSADVCVQIVDRGFFIDWDRKDLQRLAAAPAVKAPEVSQPAVAKAVVLEDQVTGSLKLSPSPAPDGGGLSTNPKFNPAVRPQ